MCRHRTASATIAQLMVAVFVSLHRDSESAKNHFPSWRNLFPQLGKMKLSNQVINLDSKPRYESFSFFFRKEDGKQIGGKTCV